MKYIIGLRLAEDTSAVIANFIRFCKGAGPDYRFRAIHPSYPKIIPIGRSKNELPNESLHLTLPMENCRLKVFDGPGNMHRSLQLVFKSNYVQSRLFDMAGIDPATAGKGVKKRYVPRILLGFFCSYCDMGWIHHLPIKELNIVEQVSIPFDPKFPHYADQG